MAQGRKRKRNGKDASEHKPPVSSSVGSPVQRDLLVQCYPYVRTLRDHVLSQLPDSSRLRRKKIARLGANSDCSEIESQLAHVLDTALVCTTQTSLKSESEETRWQQWLYFTQKGDESYVTLSDGIPSSIANQSEIIDFVIWLLFSRETGAWPKHLLCDGFRTSKNVKDCESVRSTIPGILSRYPNFHVKALREAPWPHLLALLGQSGERVMINLLVDCSIFVKVDAGLHNYYQLSGVPLSELSVAAKASNNSPKIQTRKPSEVTLVRSRIFYAKPAMTAKGLVQPGFRHIHALNRLTYTQELVHPDHSPSRKALTEIRQLNEAHTTRLMMYIFPRQFGLHNVFTSEVNTTQTAQKFQDYTLREEEIAKAMANDKALSEDRLPKLPRRLRGPAKELVQRLQILHGRCSYFELLRHYCPSSIDGSHRLKKSSSSRDPISGAKTVHQLSTAHGVSQRDLQAKRHTRKRHLNPQLSHAFQNNSLVDLASPTSHVSAFCQAVLCKIIPDKFWGDGGNCHNKAVFLRKIDHFIKLRRFEAISLHELAQDFKITELAWLQSPSCEGRKSSQTDTNKRYEIFHEFLYYVFDSLLIPLIRSNFYVTESNTHRFQVFYFRHDVWRLVAEPGMSDLRASMFEEIKLNEAKQILDSRRLGFSQIRLLPKGTKLRPITNLRRRCIRDGKGNRVLCPSINSVLAPIHTVLKLEKEINPSKLGSTLFAVGDIYECLKSFKNSMGSNQHTFYFAKVDVKAAFDTIPQAAVVKLMGSVPSQKQYTITKHAEVKPGDTTALANGTAVAKPSRRWHATAVTQRQPPAFLDRLENNIGARKKNTVFVDNAAPRPFDVHALLSLIAEHVGQNIVKIGKKYYRQKKGIPQGSVLSSFLCNYFYADLEAQHLSFLDAPDCLLMRLIDDFLLITLDKSKAVRFVETMHRGVPDYGVEVGRDKTLVNFEMSVGRESIRKITKESKFPYCGTFINCQTLEITKDREKDKNMDISTSLTVEFGRSPGQNFQRKVLNAFKIQSHLMFFDMALNSIDTVLDSLHGALSETALKMWAYIRCLPASRQPSANLIIRTIGKVADIAFLILTSKWRKMQYASYTCNVRKAQVTAIAYSAFLKVLGRKQTKYGTVIAWLRDEVARLGTVRQK